MNVSVDSTFKLVQDPSKNWSSLSRKLTEDASMVHSNQGMYATNDGNRGNTIFSNDDLESGLQNRTFQLENAHIADDDQGTPKFRGGYDQESFPEQSS